MQTDKEGFLVDLESWSPEVAIKLAEQEGLTLGPEHFEIIDAARLFYQEYDLSPVNRVLVKQVASIYGPEKGNSIYIQKLFPQGPAKLVCKIAGLPKPNNCL